MHEHTIFHSTVVTLYPHVFLLNVKYTCPFPLGSTKLKDGNGGLEQDNDSLALVRETAENGTNGLFIK